MWTHQYQSCTTQNKRASPQTRTKPTNITENLLRRSPRDLNTFQKHTLLFPNQWHRVASHDTPYLSRQQQKHWDKETKQTVPSLIVIHVKTLWVTAKEERHSVCGYHFIQSRCIYFAKSLAWDGFQKHPLLGWTEAELPLEMSYGKALDPTNSIPETTSRSNVVKALTWIYIGLNMKDKRSIFLTWLAVFSQNNF